MPRSWLSPAGKGAPSAIYSAARDEIPRAAASGRDRSKEHAQSGSLGLPPETERRWLSHPASQPASRSLTRDVSAIGGRTMRRRDFLKSGAVVAGASTLVARPA